ncbi:MAG: serine/threonine protein kinase [Bdellovibrionota bacterium]|mgnify:CR=1 FL=1
MSKEDFYSLTPDYVLDAVDAAGFRTTGELLQLNSYENRVFELSIEPDSSPHSKVIAKFYRPGRWSEECILEEHEFIFDLLQNDLPVVAPLIQPNGSSLSLQNGILMAVFPKARGRLVQELNDQELVRVGRSLAKMHNIGEQKEFQHRPILDTESYGWDNIDHLQSWISPEVRSRYTNAAEDILYFLEDRLDPLKKIRIHADVHKGNLLQVDMADQVREYFFVDFDDCATGNPIQDLWMLMPGNEEDTKVEMAALLEGYTEFRHFNHADLEVIPALRGLRIIHYAAWIARRWKDPSFPRLFPNFSDYNYWAAETDALEGIARGLG